MLPCIRRDRRQIGFDDHRAPAPFPVLWDRARPRLPALTHQPLFQCPGPSLRWIRDNEGNGHSRRPSPTNGTVDFLIRA